MKRVGIIGCGGIARVHAWALKSMENIALTAFCDIDAMKAEALANQMDGMEKPSGEQSGSENEARIYTDWQALCKADLDVVHVCTPHHLHAPMAVELLQSGKAVFVEKPCAISREQFIELKNADERHPGKLGFCFQNRYNETTILLDRLVMEGRIGKILGGRAMVTWRRDEDYYLNGVWKGKLETEGGGVLINQSIHTLDLLLRYMGEPTAIRGSIANYHLSENLIEVEDTVSSWMEFQGGMRACFFASNAYAGDAPVYLEVQGDKGRISMNGSEVTVFINGEAPEHYVREQSKGMGKDYWGNGHKACIGDFYQCLDTGEPFQNSLSGVERTFQVMMGIYENARKRA